MALVAAGVAMLAVTAGLRTAYVMDTPTGPTIVTLAAVLFTLATVVTQGWRLLRQRLQPASCHSGK